jgi:hypothetical protein
VNELRDHAEEILELSHRCDVILVREANGNFDDGNAQRSAADEYLDVEQEPVCVESLEDRRCRAPRKPFQPALRVAYSQPEQQPHERVERDAHPVAPVDIFDK